MSKVKKKSDKTDFEEMVDVMEEETTEEEVEGSVFSFRS